jgi:hypothetical protein
LEAVDLLSGFVIDTILGGFKVDNICCAVGSGVVPDYFVVSCAIGPGGGEWERCGGTDEAAACEGRKVNSADSLVGIVCNAGECQDGLGLCVRIVD